MRNKLIICYLVFTFLLSSCAKHLATPTADPQVSNQINTPDQAIIPSPTPKRILTPLPGKDAPVFSTQSGADGFAELVDPLSGGSLTFELADIDTNQPLPWIDISLISNGVNFLIIASDPSNTYLPLLQEFLYQEVGMGVGSRTAKMAAPRQIHPIVLLFKALSTIETMQDWMAYYKANQPDLERWGFYSQDYCVNSDQLIEAGILAGKTLISLPNFDPPSQLSRLDDLNNLAYISVLFEIDKKIVEETVYEKLQTALQDKVDAIVRWRVFSINGYPFGLPAIPTGYCLEPLDRTSNESLLSWFSYGLENNDMFVFDRLVFNGELGYGIPNTEAISHITRDEVLRFFSVGLPNHPKCRGYGNEYDQLVILTSDWQPQWDLRYVIDFQTGDQRPVAGGSSSVLFVISDGYINAIGLGIYPPETDAISMWQTSDNTTTSCPKSTNQMIFTTQSDINQTVESAAGNNTNKKTLDDFSTYQKGSPPEGWLLRGEKSITPKIAEFGGNGVAYQVVEFPEVEWEYWDKWLIKTDSHVSESYSVTVKLMFLTEVADRAGITIAWNDNNWDHIDIQPNLYSDEIELRITYTGSIASNPVINRLNFEIIDHTYYWLRAVVSDKGPGKGEVIVYWSKDGVEFNAVATVKGLASVDGLIGISTAGPHLPEMVFDDFEVIGN